MPETVPAIRLDAVSRVYSSAGADVWAVKEVSLSVKAGEVVAVTGPSGSGKTTLLNLIGGLDRATSGDVIVHGQVLNRLKERELTAYRAQSLGLVFQDSYLLPGLTALENVAVARLPWRSRRELEREARELLAAVGLVDRMDFPPNKLSGGERQRVGIARALLGQPVLLLADEPTGNLDARTTEDLIALLDQLHERLGFTMMVATHDPAVAAMASRVLRLVGGQVDGERRDDGQTAPDVHTLE
jgi:putative ABC transport system ATP-binding protein